MKAAALLAFLPLSEGFEVRSTAVSGRVVSHGSGDLDGDGALDLLVATVPAAAEAGDRRILVFRGRPDGTFAEAADVAIPVKKDVLAWTVGPIGEEGGDRIVFLTRGGAFAFDARTGEYRGNVRRIGTFASLFLVPDPEDLPRWAHVADVDGDGSIEILVPERGRAIVLGRDPSDPAAAWIERGAIPLGPPGRRQRRTGRRELRIAFGSAELTSPSPFLEWRRGEGNLLSAEASLPIPAFADADGDGRLDLFALEGKEVRIHRQDGGGRFPADPTWRGTIAAAEGWPSEVRLADFDGDGRADLLALGPEGGKALSGTQIVHLLRGEGGEIRLEPPAGLWRVEGLDLWTEPVDLDGDGSKDLALVSVEVPGTVEALAGGAKVEWRFLLFRGAGEGGLERTPSLRFSESFSASQTVAGRMIATLGGDLDGDGVRDLVRAGPDARLAIHPIVRDAGGRLERQAAPVFTAPVEEEPFDLAILDLGTPKRTTLLVFSRSGFTRVRRR